MTPPAAPGPQRTPPRRKEVFRHLRAELDIEVTRAPKKLPYVPAEAEIRAFYDAVSKARRASDVMLIKSPALYRRPGF